MIVGGASLLLKTGAKDPFFDNVVSLLHFEGTNGSTTFTDEIGNTVTANGDAQISTSSPLVGDGSLKCDGTNDYIKIDDTNGAFDVGTGDFTIEIAFRIDASTGANQNIIYLADGSSLSDIAITFQYNNTTGKANGSLVSGSTTYNLESATTISIGTNYRLGIVRNSGVARLFLDQVEEDSIAAAGSLNYSAAQYIDIGERVGTRDANATFDEFRFTNGVARDLTQPLQIPFPDE